MSDEKQHFHCDHDHHHSDGHSHHHGIVTDVRLAFWLNLLFAVIELIGGLWVSSMAVISDALHDFGDSLSLGFAWWAEGQKTKAPTGTYGFGFRRWTVLSTLFLQILLLGGSLVVMAQSGYMLMMNEHETPLTSGMMGLAILGILVNGFVFFRLSKSHKTNFLSHALRWHFIEDLLGWIAVLFGALVIHFTGWGWIDPLLAMLIAMWIFRNVVREVRVPLDLLLQAVPKGLDLKKVEGALLQIELVASVHHLRVWSLDGEKHVLTTHLVLKKYPLENEWLNLKSQIKSDLRSKFKIYEVNLEFEILGDNCHENIK